MSKDNSVKWSKTLNCSMENLDGADITSTLEKRESSDSV